MFCWICSLDRESGESPVLRINVQCNALGWANWKREGSLDAGEADVFSRHHCWVSQGINGTRKGSVSPLPVATKRQVEMERERDR